MKLLTDQIKNTFPFIVAGILLLDSAGRTDPENYIHSVVNYEPGTGFATEFGTGSGYTNLTAILGEPSKVIPGNFGGPVHPFNPPFLKEQLLSIGDQGRVTVQFESIVENDPKNPFGLDFLLFGSVGFIVINGVFDGGGITDGSTFSHFVGVSKVFVSSDNDRYYLLNPDLAPRVDSIFPTDGLGNFSLPVDPNLEPSQFGGEGLPGLRHFYSGSGGGTGFDLDWAVDENGLPVVLQSIQYVRIEITGGHAEIDALSDVDPEWTLTKQDFSSNPLESGWTTFGKDSLFQWSSELGALNVTWDTESPNSFFYFPLGITLGKSDDFQVAFDLSLESQDLVSEGFYGFEISVGLIHLQDAFGSNFKRGTGSDSPNIVEFDYFPDTGFGATISPAMVSQNNQFAATFNFPLELDLGTQFHVNMDYDSANQTLNTTMTRDGISFGPIAPVVLTELTDFNGNAIEYSDFQVDAFSISSYQDFDQNGSMLTKGLIDNIVIKTPPAPIQKLRGRLVENSWKVSFRSRNGWNYILERSLDFQIWAGVSESTPGTGGFVELEESAMLGEGAFLYRVRAERSLD